MKKKRIETTMTAVVVVDAVRRVRFHLMTTLPRLIPSREKSAMSTPSPRHDGRGSVQTLFYRYYDSPALVPPLSLFTIGLGEVDVMASLELEVVHAGGGGGHGLMSDKYPLGAFGAKKKGHGEVDDGQTNSICFETICLPVEHRSEPADRGRVDDGPRWTDEFYQF